MKYSKKQIREAFLNWNTDVRLNPNDFLTHEDLITELSVQQEADKNTETLISYISNK